METNNSNRVRRRQRTARTAVFVAALATGLLAVAGTSGAGGGRSGEAGLQAVRSLTKKYHNEAAAVAAGYVRTDECVPGMGYHYVNFGLLDDKLQPSRPEFCCSCLPPMAAGCWLAPSGSSLTTTRT